jgi:hypothetical protein
LSSITANGTAGTLMTARVNVTLIGSGTPARANVTLTLVPAGPVSFPDTSFDAHAGDGAGVDHQDPVTGLHAALLPRRAREHGGDRDLPVLRLDLHPDAAVIVAQRVALEAGELLRRIEVGVGVVQILHQAPRGLLVDVGIRAANPRHAALPSAALGRRSWNRPSKLVLQDDGTDGEGDRDETVIAANA